MLQHMNNSLYALESKLKESGCNVVYLLPEKALEMPWFSNACLNHKFILIDNTPKQATDQLEHIFKEICLNIVHTHFDGYRNVLIY